MGMRRMGLALSMLAAGFAAGCAQPHVYQDAHAEAEAACHANDLDACKRMVELVMPAALEKHRDYDSGVIGVIGKIGMAAFTGVDDGLFRSGRGPRFETYTSGNVGDEHYSAHTTTYFSNK